MTKTKRSKRNPRCINEYACWEMMVDIGVIPVTAPVECRSRKCARKVTKEPMPGPHPDPFLNGPTIEEDCLP